MADRLSDVEGVEVLNDVVLNQVLVRFGDDERAYLELLRGEIPVADALLLFNREIFGTFDLRPQLPGIVAPTLVITGEDDFITGPVCAAALAWKIPTNAAPQTALARITPGG